MKLERRIRELGNRWRAFAGRGAGEESAIARARHEAAEWKRRRHEAVRRIAALEHRLAARERDVEGLKAKLADATSARDAAQQAYALLTSRADTLHKANRDVRAAFARMQRAVLSTDVVRGTLQLRLPSALARARGPEALERHAQFRARSAAYASAADAVLDAAPDVMRTALQGLTWWVPVLRPGDEAPGSAWLQKQRFPYRTICQTRELMVGGIMLDLGANLGRMCVSRAILGDVIAAYGAEPDPLNYACLVRNAVDNGLGGLVLPDHCAIGDHDGTAWLKRTRYSGGHHIVADASDDLIEVPMYTLDSWVRRIGVDLRLTTFIKVDVQGYEPYVLAGASETLKHRHIAWQMEIGPAMLRQAGTEPGELYARLAQHFTYFTDLNKNASGPRRRPIGELAEALAYVDQPTDAQTDVLLFNEAAIACP